MGLTRRWNGRGKKGQWESEGDEDKKQPAKKLKREKRFVSPLYHAAQVLVQDV
jgi:hypothetical protein